MDGPYAVAKSPRQPDYQRFAQSWFRCFELMDEKRPGVFRLAPQGGGLDDLDSTKILSGRRKKPLKLADSPVNNVLSAHRPGQIDRSKSLSANSPRTYARSKCRTPVRSIELLFLHTRRRRSNGGVQRRGIDRSIDGDLTCPAHRSIDRCTRLAISQVDLRRQFVSNAKLPIKMQLDRSISS
ncbi:hypothetical protein [Oryza sativa Japonica Group]|uniref:Uncharacterized protein n=1 Tax=Oryza sativa subsp. japonica TaxID=39947 RepID=Q9FU18_ORYSJ|nr:hypothetical protein [Oryza sativa Japonica Group]